MSLESKLSQRNRILDKIKEKQDIINNKFNKPLLDKIDNAKKERDTILQEFREKQLEARSTTNKTLLEKLEKELIELCKRLSDIDKLLRELNEELRTLNAKNSAKSNSEHQRELDDLYRQLNDNNEDVAEERERLREKAAEESQQNKWSGLDLKLDPSDALGYQKVIIDDAFGIYINYPKGDVISTTMGCIFGAGINTVPEEYPYSKEEVMSSISDFEKPGLPTLLSMFIDTLLKAIGQGFVKQFFFFKNTIDLLAGLQLGELLGTYIPGLPKIIKDIKLLLTDPEEWMFSKMLGPLFDVNIPIPEFKLDLGALIPFLPFIIRIPGIDPYGYFKKNTPFNVNADPKDIPTDWQEKIIAETKEAEIDEENNFKDMANKRLEELNRQIKKIQDDLNGINKFTPLREKSERDLRILETEYEQLQEDVDKNVTTYDEEKLRLTEIKLKDYCQKIDKETKNLDQLNIKEAQEAKRLSELDRVALQDLLNNLIAQRNDINEQPNIVLKEFKKRALLLSYTQSIKDDELSLKLSNLWDIGVNIFNNKVTEYLQKIGHNFKDEKYISKITQLMDKFGFKFNNSTHMERLYKLGFSLNDPNYMLKLTTLKQYNIDVKNTELLLLFIEMGMNFNNDYFFDIMSALNELGVNLSDIGIMRRLNTLGFNFNNPNSPERLRVLGQYVDISNAQGYDNALSRNVNLNNPYFTEVLERYSRIGLNWNNDFDSDDSTFDSVEEEILNTVNPDEVQFLLDVIEFYKDSQGKLELVKNVYNNNHFINPDEEGRLGDYDRTLPTILAPASHPLYSDINFQYNRERFSNVANPSVPDDLEVYFDTENQYLLYIDGRIESTELRSYYNYGVYDEQTSATTLTSYDYSTNIHWVTLYDLDINKYAKYNIYLDTDLVIYDPVFQNKEGFVPNSSSRLLKEYAFPNNPPLYGKELDGKLEIQLKLELLRDFVINQGWVIDGIRVAENYGQYNEVTETRQRIINPSIDAQSIIDAANNFGVDLELVDIVQGEGQVSYDQLQGIYGNFDKLGLNVRDPNFDSKIQDFTEKLGVRADETVILDVKRNVTMKYYDYKDSDSDNRWKTIDLSTTKVDPKYYEDEGYNAEFLVTEVIDPTLDKQPTKTIVQFDSINKMGFNFQQDQDAKDSGLINSTYNEKLNKLIGTSFNISAFQTSDIVDSICALGWNFNSNNALYKFNRIVQLGFNFVIPPKSEDEDTNMKFKDMDGKLNSLTNFGFNFNNSNWDNYITDMMELGISLSENDFESIISELNAFGINLNDIDARTKMSKLKQLGIDFSSVSDFNTQTIRIGDKKWVGQMSNLSMLGIDFNDDDWLTKFNDALKFKALGIDYRDVENRQKIATLVKIGVDFDKPRDDYMQKIEGLVKLKLITIPESVERQKANYLRNREEKLKTLNDKIDSFNRILNGVAVSEIDDDIKKMKVKQNQLLNQITQLKNKDTSNMSGKELTNLSLLLEKLCDEMKSLNDSVNDKIEDRQRISKLNKTDIENEIARLEEEVLDLDNKVYLLNRDIGLAEIDKFNALDKLGLNFFDPNWMDHVKMLLDFPFDFSMPNWRDMLGLVLDLIPRNPILQWIKTLIDIIITLITMPIKTLVEIIKKFLDLIKSVIDIPLNPVKIPDWAKGIIKSFNDLIDLITGLPTLEGMLDFLFMSTAGITLIDIFVPGFADFAEKLKQLVSEYKEKVKNLKEQIKAKKNSLNDMKNAKIKRKLQLEQEKKIKETALNGGDVDSATKIENQKLKNKQEIFARNIELLKDAAKDPNLSSEALNTIKKELDRNCQLVNDLQKQIDSNNETLANLKNSDLSGDVDDLNNQLSNLDSVYDTDKLSGEINSMNEEANQLNQDADALGNFCKWKDNIDKIIELLRGLVDFEKDKPNPYDDQVKNKRDELDKLKKKMENIDKRINNINSNGGNSTSTSNNNSDDMERLRLALENLNKQIQQMEDFICNNKDGWSDSVLWSNISRLQNLEKLRDALLKDIENKTVMNEKSVTELNNDKADLQEEILKKQQEKNNLEEKKYELDTQNAAKLIELGNVAKWFPVIINIICCTPKFIVNIFVGLLNAIGYMENLPTLWEFPLLE